METPVYEVLPIREFDNIEVYCAALFERLTLRLIALGLSITTMESCTCGAIASRITDTEGASAILKGAFVTYSNDMKIRCGVPAEIIDRFGVYSAETARAMAAACRKACGADIGVGVTGSFANADPANADSVPGEVYFAVETGNGARAFLLRGIPGKTRREAKDYVAARTAEKLLEEIEADSPV